MISSEAKTIKPADVIDNTPDILKNNRQFARKYVPEMDALVQALKGGDNYLWDRAQEEILKAKSNLRS